MYKLPKGIRIPNITDISNEFNIEEINKKRSEAKIVEGFTLKEEKNKKWSFYARINIDIDKFWNLFCQLCNVLFLNQNPRGMVGFKNTQPYVGKELSLSELLSIFSDYEYELLNDGYLEFGIANFRENSFCEVFVNNFKIIYVWGSKLEEFILLMDQFNLQKNDCLQFINDFPVISEALLEDGKSHYLEVIDDIKSRFVENR
ncbi:hypothetical protein RBH29_17005 [Herbivorax sp. ANBcel31]|uniref:hypothetical protein n=1 Tax=Herbivorax sp. ANBcel31 TaxID=3069754 RepID=UPI0027B0D280|nr:hypothetical protein [Herbivorax sp. ANBcel31]MDQ2088128.1 hypothetical protein [Herbivorax sp. ANBcel31]